MGVYYGTGGTDSEVSSPDTNSETTYRPSGWDCVSTQMYTYRGCYTSTWDRSSTPDVPITEAGVQQCRDGCANAGFSYFGFECPHDGGAEVHCECGNALNEGEQVADQERQTLSSPTTHCVGPFVIDTSFGTFVMGAASRNSAYETTPYVDGYTRHRSAWIMEKHITKPGIATHKTLPKVLALLVATTIIL